VVPLDFRPVIWATGPTAYSDRYSPLFVLTRRM